MRTKEEILNSHKSVEVRQSTMQRLGSYEFTYLNLTSAAAAMDEYAREVAIEFCLKVCGQLKANPENKEHYSEDSNEAFLILLPSTILKRFELFIHPPIDERTYIPPFSPHE